MVVSSPINIDFGSWQPLQHRWHSGVDGSKDALFFTLVGGGEEVKDIRILDVRVVALVGYGRRAGSSSSFSL
jgi:hypothetical protein